MDRNSHKVRREQWLRIVTECNSRDQSIPKIQWCRMNEVNIKSFYYWQRRFRNELLIQSAASATQVPAFLTSLHRYPDHDQCRAICLADAAKRR